MSSLSAAAAVVLGVAIVAASTAAQAPQPQQAPQGPPPGQAGGPPPHFNFPAPTNLKVLPKNLTGEQVREIMEQWEGALGAHCSTCHTPDPTRKAPNGRPMLNFADDSKPEKQTARMMYRMTQDINGNYIDMIKENSGVGVSCGTCHRGHVTPEPFVAPKEEHRMPPPSQGEHLPPSNQEPPMPK